MERLAPGLHLASIFLLVIVVLLLLLLLLSAQPLGLLHEVHRDEGDLLLAAQPVWQHHLFLHIDVRVGTAEGTAERGAGEKRETLTFNIPLIKVTVCSNCTLGLGLAILP